MIASLIKVFIPTVLGFFVGIGITPVLTKMMYKYQLWKKVSRSDDENENMSQAFKQIHKERKEGSEKSTPRVGGIIIWGSILITTGLVYLISIYIPSPVSDKLNFLSRNQTLVPLAALIFGALLGLADDALQILGLGKKTDDVRYRYIKIALITLAGLVIGYWLYAKLGITSLPIPFDGVLYLGWLIIPFFILVLLAVFSSGVIDGIDGLAGGVLATVFAAYTTIAFFNNQIDIAALCGVITGSLLAFLWFNIPPARFYMGETGMLALTVVLGVVAFLTDTVLLLPLIAFPLFATSVSVVIQIISKKYFGKKVFRVAPLHHHFESLGWPSYKVTMRYWVISIVCAISGVIIVLIDTRL